MREETAGPGKGRVRQAVPETLQVRKPFSGLFPWSQAVADAIREDMAANGYDPAFPIVVWEGAIVDGHTRAKVATDLKIQALVVDKAFGSVREALAYAVHCQRDRRNLSNEGLMNAIAAIDAEYREQAKERQKELGRQAARTDLGQGPLPSKEGKGSKGESAEQTGRALGVSRSTVERVRAIEDDETPAEIKEKVRSGAVSITKGAEMARAARGTACQQTVAEPRFITRLRRATEMGEKEVREHGLAEQYVAAVVGIRDRLNGILNQATKGGMQ